MKLYRAASLIGQWVKVARKPFQQLVASWICLVMLFPHVAWAFQTSTAKEARVPVIPKAFGRVLEQWQGSGPCVVHIQDLHCNYEVQKNIAGILGYLAEHHDVQWAAIEGADKPVNVTKLSTFPLAQARENVGDYFVRQGKISGAEYYAATGKRPMRLIGVEQPEQYQMARQMVVGFLTDECEGYIMDVRERLNEAKKNVFNPQLLKVDQQRQGFHSGTLSLYKYVRYLEQFAHTLALGLDAYPNVCGYLKQLTAVIPETVDSDRLYAELEQLDIQVRQLLYRRAEERGLDEIGHRVDIMEKMLNVAAAPADIQTYRRQPHAFKIKCINDFLVSVDGEDNQGLESDVFQLDDYMQKAEAFYTNADQRSDDFVEGTLKHIAAEQATVIVLITGGYHSPKILEQLRAQGISYVEVKPNLTQQDLLNPYFSLLKKRKTPMEKLLAQTQTIVALEPFFALTEKITQPINEQNELTREMRAAYAWMEISLKLDALQLLRAQGAKGLDVIITQFANTLARYAADAQAVVPDLSRSILAEKSWVIPMKNAPFFAVLETTAGALHERKGVLSTADLNGARVSYMPEAFWTQTVQGLTTQGQLQISQDWLRVQMMQAALPGGAVLLTGASVIMNTGPADQPMVFRRGGWQAQWNQIRSRINRFTPKPFLNPVFGLELSSVRALFITGVRGLAATLVKIPWLGIPLVEEFGIGTRRKNTPDWAVGKVRGVWEAFRQGRTLPVLTGMVLSLPGIFFGLDLRLIIPLAIVLAGWINYPYQKEFVLAHGANQTRSQIIVRSLLTGGFNAVAIGVGVAMLAGMLPQVGGFMYVLAPLVALVTALMRTTIVHAVWNVWLAPLAAWVAGFVKSLRAGKRVVVSAESYRMGAIETFGLLGRFDQADEPVRVDEESQATVAEVFNVLHLDLSAVNYAEQLDGMKVAVPVASLNPQALRDAWELPADYPLQELRVSVVFYNRLPMYVVAEEETGPSRIMDLSGLYQMDKQWIDQHQVSINGKAYVIFSMPGQPDTKIEVSVDRAFPYEVSHKFKTRLVQDVLGGAETVWTSGSYTYAQFSRSGDLSELKLSPVFKPKFSWMTESQGLKVKLVSMPGVFHGVHPSSLIAGRAVAKLAAPGKRILVIGTGIGLEALIAAQRGAQVDATDINLWAVEATRRLLEKQQVPADRVRVFVQDLFPEGQKYDGVVFNMPHYKSYLTHGESADYKGVLFLRVAEQIKDHLTPEGVGVLVNTENPNLEKWLAEKSRLNVISDFFDADGSSKAILVGQGDRVYQYSPWAQMMMKSGRRPDSRLMLAASRALSITGVRGVAAALAKIPWFGIPLVEEFGIGTREKNTPDWAVGKVRGVWEAFRQGRTLPVLTGMALSLPGIFFGLDLRLIIPLAIVLAGWINYPYQKEFVMAHGTDQSPAQIVVRSLATGTLNAMAIGVGVAMLAGILPQAGGLMLVLAPLVALVTALMRSTIVHTGWNVILAPLASRIVGWVQTVRQRHSVRLSADYFRLAIEPVSPVPNIPADKPKSEPAFTKQAQVKETPDEVKIQKPYTVSPEVQLLERLLALETRPTAVAELTQQPLVKPIVLQALSQLILSGNQQQQTEALAVIVTLGPVSASESVREALLSLRDSIDDELRTRVRNALMAVFGEAALTVPYHPLTTGRRNPYTTGRRILPRNTAPQTITARDVMRAWTALKTRTRGTRTFAEELLWHEDLNQAMEANAESMASMQLTAGSTFLVTGPSSQDVLPLLLAELGVVTSVIDVDPVAIEVQRQLYEETGLADRIHVYTDYAALGTAVFNRVSLFAVLVSLVDKVYRDRVQSAHQAFVDSASDSGLKNRLLEQLQKEWQSQVRGPLQTILDHVNPQGGHLLVNQPLALSAQEVRRRSDVSPVLRSLYYLDELLIQLGKERGMQFTQQPQIQLDTLRTNLNWMQEGRKGIAYRMDSVSRGSVGPQEKGRQPSLELQWQKEKELVPEQGEFNRSGLRAPLRFFQIWRTPRQIWIGILFSTLTLVQRLTPATSLDREAWVSLAELKSMYFPQNSLEARHFRAGQINSRGLTQATLGERMFGQYREPRSDEIQLNFDASQVAALAEPETGSGWLVHVRHALAQALVQQQLRYWSADYYGVSLGSRVQRNVAEQRHTAYVRTWPLLVNHALSQATTPQAQWTALHQVSLALEQTAGVPTIAIQVESFAESVAGKHTQTLRIPHLVWERPALRGRLEDALHIHGFRLNPLGHQNRVPHTRPRSLEQAA